MGIWELKISATDVTAAAQTSGKISPKGVASEYAKILDEKISNIEADVERMKIVQKNLDEIREMHEELTGEIKID